MDSAKKTTTSDVIFAKMLERIETGEWAVGTAIPSERQLMEEMGVSRISIREALARMRAFGLMRISHGRKTTIEKMDVRILGRIFPVLLALEGDQNFLHFLQLRITLESQAAFSAAMNRTDSDIAFLEQLLEEVTYRLEDGMTEDAIDRDYAFHIGIARVCKNPLFPMLIEALSAYLAPSQISSFRWEPEDLDTLNTYHKAIVDAIRDRRGEAARRHMENHLRASAGQIICDGLWHTPKEGRTSHSKIQAGG